MQGIGVVFDIDDLGGGFYGAQAWRIFMRQLSPHDIPGSYLFEGDTRDTLHGEQRDFCIAVRGIGLEVEKIRSAFESCSEKGLAELSRRFISTPALDAEPLCETASVDYQGRLVTDQWTRVFHDLCKDCEWGYAPTAVTEELTPELKSELEAMMSDPASQAATTQSEVSHSEDQTTKSSTERSSQASAQSTTPQPSTESCKKEEDETGDAFMKRSHGDSARQRTVAGHFERAFGPVDSTVGQVRQHPMTVGRKLLIGVACLVFGIVVYSVVLDAARVDEADVYRHALAHRGGGARDLAVMTTGEGKWNVTATSHSSTAPGVGGASQITVYADALGSQNIRIRIGEIGYTDYAGLRFTQPATANIWDDGTVELDRVGITATDSEGNDWISRRMRYAGRWATLMVRK